jgi:hypothetical protein
MKNNIVKILIGLLIVGLIIFLIVKLNPPEKSFNQIPLQDNNSIVNGVFPTYYDTVLNVAMSQMELSGYKVIMEQISGEAKSQFDGELKAHIRYYNNDFYLFTGSLSRNESIEVLCHEVIHMQQYTSGDLIYNNGNITWKGETLELNSKEYENRPWEKDAFSRQTQLIKTVKDILYTDK